MTANPTAQARAQIDRFRVLKSCAKIEKKTSQINIYLLIWIFFLLVTCKTKPRDMPIMYG